MNVTPNKAMFAAMQVFTDAMCGDSPGPLEFSKGSKERRKQRRLMMDFLHSFAALAMREGAARAMNTVAAPGEPTPKELRRLLEAGARDAEADAAKVSH